MKCELARDLLMKAADGRRLATGLSAHLEVCAECSTVARRLERLRAELSARRLDHSPDPDFARRVVAALPDGPDLLGWAALRLLPAAVALALVLTGWCWLATPGPVELVESSPTDDLLAWTLDEESS